MLNAGRLRQNAQRWTLNATTCWNIYAVALKMETNYFLLLKFIKEKGGIHAINRSIMDTFGLLLLTERPKK